MENKIQICALDFSEEDIAQLQKNQDFSIYSGSAGKKVSITYYHNRSSEYCLLNYNYPQNLHEYDIILINMNHHDTIPFKQEDHEHKHQTKQQAGKLLVRSPQNIFDPRAYSFEILKENTLELYNKKSLIIAFADKAYNTTYQPIIIESGHYIKRLDKQDFSNYSFLKHKLISRARNGKKVNILAKNKNLFDLLEEFKNDLEYHQTFEVPTEYDSNINQFVQAPYFHKLIENSHNEIISYLYQYEHLAVFVFPNIGNKAAFLSAFLKDIAPDFVPELFSINNQFGWVTDKSYWPPNHENLIQEKEKEIERHKEKLIEIENKISQNQNNFKYLQNLLVESDDTLVKAVIQFMTWLGFENVIEFDLGKEDNFEEDIQIDVDGKLLVIEVKGIGGTSKDHECSQISKIRLRRIREKKSSEVYALYIVNHERYKPPLSRKNPPFSKHQIQDAHDDLRGLITTWELFKIYYAIQEGIFIKKEIREKLFDYGVIDFKSLLTPIGKIDKVFNEISVASMKIENGVINTQDSIIIEKEGKLSLHKVISLQQNKQKIQSCNKGRVGLKLNKPAKRNSFVWKK